MTAVDRLAQIEARAIDCRTYRFGMRNADQLAHHDVPDLLAALRTVLEVHAPLGGWHVDGARCAGCSGRYIHPCPTVRALDDALGGAR